jgi:hypothetical protein
MKKLLLSVCIIATAAFVNKTSAQLSQGGTPFSFNNGSKSIKPITFVEMPSFNLADLQAEDAINDLSKGPFRFGYNHMVNLNLSNSGNWTTLPNGDRLWQLGVKSTGAHSINLAFNDFFLPKGASMFIYNSTKDFVIGAFTSVNNQLDKEFATDLVHGDAMVIEYYEPANVANQGTINLYRVTHGYRGVEEYVAKTFDSAGVCQININCSLGTNWQMEKHSVVCLVSSGNEFCSGALVNDVPRDGKPYILTANHCGASGFGSWVFRFNWEAPGCANPPSSPSTAQSLSGGTQRASSANSDFSLVEITGGLSAGTIPSSYAPYFSGWSNLNIAPDSVWGIHHPSGDIKKISHAPNACTSNTWSGTPADSHWKIGQWTMGCTEPGSSGSPLFDQNHRIVGQLHGGPSSCIATPANMNDFYGKFSMSWLGGGTASTQLKAWLDPANTGATVLDGWNPLSINEYSSPSIVSIYPNPTNGLFNVELTLTATQNVTMKVFNVLGKVVVEKSFTNISSGIYSIDLSTEAAGLYFVEVASPTSKTVKKINVVR